MGGHVPAGAGANAGAAITAATTAGVVAAIGLDQYRHSQRLAEQFQGYIPIDTVFQRLAWY